MISIGKESLMELKDELLPLFKAHADEVRPYREFSLNPLWEIYEQLEDDDKVVMYVARDGDDIIGYVIYFVSESLHYRNEVFATMDIVYLDPEYRGGNTAEILLQEAEDYLYSIGVTMIDMRMKVFASFESLAKHMNYDKMEYVYTKYLGD